MLVIVPELLLELFGEEIPARMQDAAATQLCKRTTDALSKAGLTCGNAQAFATPRRLTLCIKDLSARSDDVSSEQRGPRVDSPDKAIEGFLRKVGLARVEDAEIRRDEKRGDYYVAIIETPGRPAPDIIAEAVSEIIGSFSWPKSMRWGPESADKGALRWVRPLHSILCVFDGETVPIKIGGLVSGNHTRGHRFMANRRIKADNFAAYEKKLRGAKVMLDARARRQHIRTHAQTLATAHGLSLIEDEGLITETAGLVEWPVVLIGEFDRVFLDLPDEVIVGTIKKHQKCFCLRDAETGDLANRFILVANLEAEDAGQAIVDGNQRVIRARLGDAQFFWNEDQKRPLAERRADLDRVRFHERLGSQGERVQRLCRLAQDIAPRVAAPVDNTVLAANLAKLDLTTGLVGEFPDLQGKIGRYYALHDGVEDEIAQAIEDHYRPRGPGDAVPLAPVSIAVALADKIDILTGFWAIGEKPTGSKDPYALRRAALGVIRIVLENDLRLPLLPLFHLARDDFADQADDLLAFHVERLKIYMRDKGARHDLIDAVLAQDMGRDDLRLIVKRVDALANFLNTGAGEDLLSGYRRATNIVRSEADKQGIEFSHNPTMALMHAPQEYALADAIALAEHAVRDVLRREDFAAAMEALAELRPYVDGFFEHVMVNADDPDVRVNRLTLLNRLRAAMHQVADFSKVDG